MMRVPSDCTLLPLSNGLLAVSASRAVFCRIPPNDIDAFSRVLRGELTTEDLGDKLRLALREHGFFSQQRLRKKSLPKIQLQLTNACNLSCEYCCTNSQFPRAEELDESDFAQILKDIHERFENGASVSFLGGEPFLIPWTTRLANLALDLGLTLTIFSNALPLASDDALLEAVADLTKRGVTLRISLAGTSREQCDNLSCGQRFDSVLKVLNGLHQKGGNARIDLMLMPQNAQNVAIEFSRFRKKIPPGFSVSLGIMYVSGREKGEHLFETREAFEQALTDIAFEAGEIIEAPLPQPKMMRRDGCDCAMGLNLNVRSDGGLFPCFKMEEQIGQVQNMSIRQALKKIRNNPHPAHELQTCRECTLNSLCGGGCRSDNFLFTGTEEPLCGPWRVRVVSELLAEDCVGVVHWSVPHLFAEARRRGIDCPDSIRALGISRHCSDI